MPTNNRYLHTCSGCGSKFYPTESGGYCPYCRTTTPALQEFYKRYSTKLKARQKQIRTAILRLSLIAVSFIALIILIISLISGIVKNSEKLIYEYGKVSNQPVFYTDSDGKVYYLSHKNESVLIGKGKICDFAASFNGKIVYAVLEGTTDIDSLNLDKSMLLKISDYKEVSTIAESSYGEISIASGGNCEYLYFLITETLGTYQSSGRLNLYIDGTDSPKRICDYSVSGDFDDFKVSANGRYLIYKVPEGENTKLMKYSVRTDESENLGVKNSEPVSIDNKGKYFSYLRMNEYNLLDFYIESSVSDREGFMLESMIADRIVVSSDYRSFVIEAGQLTSFVSKGEEGFTLLTQGADTISLDINNYKSQELCSSSGEYVKDIDYSNSQSFLPFYYLPKNEDSRFTLMAILADGTKKALVDTGFDGYTTDGTKIAYFTQNALYTANADISNISQKLVSENFSRYTPNSMSCDGKYVFLYDKDRNVYRIPYKFNGSNLVNVATDAQIYKTSDDGKEIYYISGDALYYGAKSQAYRVCEKVVSDSVFVRDDFSRVYYLASSTNSKAENSYGLYVYDGKNNKAISMNITDIITTPSDAISYSVMPSGVSAADAEPTNID